MMIIEKIHNKYIYWKHKLEERKNLNAFCKGHQVKLYNWSRPFPQDLWLINFIEQRGLLKDKPKRKIGLYSIFAPYWLHHFDGCNTRISTNHPCRDGCIVFWTMTVYNFRLVLIG